MLRNSFSIKKVVFICLFAALTACSTGSSNNAVQGFESKEKLYESTKNYNSLISLYRDTLKTREDPLVRYKLANSYYLSGDSKSSLLYLSPLLNGNSELAQKATILQIKNLIQTKEYNQAISVADAFIKRVPNNGEAYNLRGIALAQVGRLEDARQNMSQARELFINDVVAINNIAMLSIINGDYHNATDLLLPQYLKGVKDQRLIHNLVFALVKSGDTKYAKDIIMKERLNTSPDALIEALQKTERVSGGVRR